MAVNIIERPPVCYGIISKGVVAREMELTHELFQIGSETFLHKERGETMNQQTIEHHDTQQCYQCLQALLSTDFKYT